MKKIIATFLWNTAAFLIRIAEKLHKTGRATFTRIEKTEQSTITLSAPMKEAFKTGDKIIIFK